MKDEAEPAELKAAFLAESVAVLPSVAWTPKGDALVFPAVSPSLGTLEVGFNSGEITLYFGHRGYHQHHTPDDEPKGTERSESVRRAAREAIEFVATLVGDEVVFRWGLLVSGTHPRRPPSIPRRIWRWITPWVRETVWSGRTRPN